MYYNISQKTGVDTVVFCLLFAFHYIINFAAPECAQSDTPSSAYYRNGLFTLSPF